MKLTPRLALLSLLLAPALPLPVASGQHYPRTLHPWSTGPGDLANVYEVELGDLDGDGNRDLVGVLRNKPGSLRVAMGDGSGQFGPVSVYPVGNDSDMVRVADVNDDGFDDVFVANEDDSTVSVFISDGIGGWSQQYLLGLTGLPRAMAMGRVDGDGYPDLVVVVTSQVSTDLMVLRSDGNGGFAAPLIYPNAFAYDVEIGDLNQDSIPDLVFGDLWDVDVWLGDGLGGYPIQVQYQTTFYNQSVSIEDMDQDGWPDVVTSGGLFGDGFVAVLLNDQTGNLGPTAEFQITRVPNGHETLDLDQDGYLDVVASADLPWFDLLVNDQAGGLLPSTRVYSTNRTYDLETGDADNDGFADIISNTFSGFTVHLADGQGGLIGPEISADPGPFSVGDVNRDGLPDLVGLSASGLVVAAGDGTGTFPAGTPTGPTGRVAVETMLTDLNGDGEADLVAALATAEVVAYLGDGQGNFTDQGSFATDNYPNDLAIGDLNGDNFPDAVTSNREGFPTASSSLSVLLGQGDGTFLPQLSVTTSWFARGLAVLDVDEDGLDDVVAATSDRPSVFLSDGNGNLTLSSRLQASDKAIRVRAIDMNDDRVLDLVFALDAPFLGGGIEVFLGDGLGGYAAPVALPSAPVEPYDFVAGDVDGDGSTELAVLGNIRDIFLYQQDGAGQWRLHQQVVAGAMQGDAHLTMADVNVDGRLDLVARSRERYTDELHVLLDRSPLPPGVTPFGPGTPGCLGQSTLIAPLAPTVGSNDFGVYCANAPENAAGLLLIGTAPDLSGTKVGGLVFHIDLAATAFLMLQPFPSGTGPGSFLKLPIPDWPQIAGSSATVQVMWQWPKDSACAPTSSHRGMSGGLILTFQP